MAGFFTRGWANVHLLAAKLCSTQLDRATSTTLTDVAGCSHKLEGGAKYIFEAHITGTSTANGGAKAAIAGDSALTAAAFTCTATNRNNATTNAAATTTTLGTAVAGATAVMTDYIILGSITVGVGGVCKLQFAQNASHADTSSVYVGSYLKFTRVY